MKRRIKLIKCFSGGKNSKKNDDDMFIGENYAAVIDGVSYKSAIHSKGKDTGIAQIITEAIASVDKEEALNFETFIKYVNNYIATYLRESGNANAIGKVEATGVIYSKHYNQLWLIGDCRAIYDGKSVSNPLKIEDEVYTDIRCRLLEALIQAGYNEEDLIKDDIAKKIIKHPYVIDDDSIGQENEDGETQKLRNVLKTFLTEEKRKELKDFWRERIRRTLIDCGFSEKTINENDLINKYLNPRDLMQFFKNNPNVGEWGYSIFNGIQTEQKNCVVKSLPEDVRRIVLFSDGFSIEDFLNNRDLEEAIKHNYKTAEEDKLGVNQNRGIHGSQRYSADTDVRTTDDRTAIIFSIEKEREIDTDEGR